MSVFTWICIVIDAIVALLLVGMLFNPNQDPAGKAFLALPILLMIICAGLAWFLMTRNNRISALMTSAVPAVIAVYFLFLTIRK
jgi:hypothetical protein